MKRIILSISVIALCASISFSQVDTNKATIKWSSDFRNKNRKLLSGIIGNDETGYYSVSKVEFKTYGGIKTITYINHYDQNLQLTKSVELELGEKKEARSYESSFIFNNKLYVVSSIKMKREQKFYYYLQEIDKGTLKPKIDYKVLAAINYEKTKFYYYSFIDYRISRDKSKLLIIYSFPYAKDKNEKKYFIVFDKNTNELWHKNLTNQPVQKSYGIIDYNLDNQGDVHILYRSNKEKGTYKKGEPYFSVGIIGYGKKGNEVKHYPIQGEDKFFHGMRIAVNDEEDIICAGFYSSFCTYSSEGTCFLKIDEETEEITTTVFHKFGMDILTENLNEKQTEKIRKKAEKGENIELKNYKFDKIIMREDGGAVLIAEHFYTETSYSNDVDNYSYSSKSYHFDNIIVLSISPEGKLEWTEKIAKKQESSFREYCSYALAEVKDKLYFVFNDNPKNLDYNGAGPVYDFTLRKKSNGVLVTLNPDGQQKREVLYSSEDSKLIATPYLFKQSSDNELIISGRRTFRYHRLGKITFKE